MVTIATRAFYPIQDAGCRLSGHRFLLESNNLAYQWGLDIKKNELVLATLFLQFCNEFAVAKLFHLDIVYTPSGPTAPISDD